MVTRRLTHTPAGKANTVHRMFILRTPRPRGDVKEKEQANTYLRSLGVKP